MKRQSQEEPLPPEATGEYSTLTLGSSWGAVSLLFFVLAITSRQLVRLLPPELHGWNIMPPVAVLAVPPLSLVGLLLGVIGLKREGRRGLALLGTGLNGIVFLLSVALLLGFWWVRMR